MSAGRIIAVAIVLVALVGGVLMWWLQTRAFYFPVEADSAALTIVPEGDAPRRPIPVDDFEGIDSDSSPIRYRACFTTDPAIADDARVAENPTPLNAPGWFDCFDAEEIGTALEAGEAIALVSRANEPYGVDRIIALYPDGRGYAWTQLNRCGEAIFGGEPAPESCPAPPPET